MLRFTLRAIRPRPSGRPGIGRLVRAGLIGSALAVEATASTQEAPSKPDTTPRTVGTAAAPHPGNSADPARTAFPSETEVAALRAEVAGQLQAIGSTTPPPAATAPTAATATGAGPAPPASAKASPAPESAVDNKLRELLQERRRTLEEYDQALSAFKKASRPEPSPEKQADEVRTELARLQALLAQAGMSPEVLLPQAFRAIGPGGKPAVSAEMKDAIEAATGECKESQARLESLRAEVMNWEAQQNARRAERDKLFQAVAAMKARGPDRPEATGTTTAPASVAASPSSQQLARERRVNAAWKSRLTAMKLQAVEAQIALEAKLAGVRELGVQVAQAQVQVAGKALELMQSRYNAAAEQQEQALKARAAAEENTARRSDDPLERYRARRRADLLDLEAQVIKHEQALATSPSPSLDEQLGLADRALRDFTRVKELLDDGRVSRLDAIRLNNDFRRIGPERDRLLRNEMAVAEARLQYYEDALTGVEIELLQDSLHDRYELELLKESLPPARWAEGEGSLADLERTHRTLLIRRRKALEQLCDLTEQTLDQIARRLAILDEEYSFIRTHIFWVRDQEPIGPGTIQQGARECQHLLKALVRLVQEATNRRDWGRPSPEFFTAALAALGLPFGLVRVRRMLRARIVRDLPAAQPSATRGA